MAVKQLWSDSFVGRCVSALGLAVDNSGLINWYRGSDNYHNLTLLKNSFLFRLLTLKGKALAWVINGLGKLLRPFIKPSGSLRVFSGINASLLEYPVRLASFFGLGVLLANTAIKLMENFHPSLRSLVLRGGLLVVLLLGTTIKTSWRQLTENSVVARAVDSVIWGD